MDSSLLLLLHITQCNRVSEPLSDYESAALTMSKLKCLRRLSVIAGSSAVSRGQTLPRSDFAMPLRM